VRVHVHGERLCCRAAKEIVGMRNCGLDVSVSTAVGGVVNEEFLPFLGPIEFLSGRPVVGSDVDILHLHCEPFPDADWLDSLDVPVVLDVHDLETIRDGEIKENEEGTLLAADGILFPGPSYQKKAEEYFPPLGGKLRAWLPSAVPRAWFCYDRPRKYVGGVAYQGALALPGQKGAFSYADYTTQVAASEEVMYLYSAGVDEDQQAWYQNLGAIYRPRMSYFELLSELTRHEWGLVAPGRPCEQWRTALPNKFFDYAAAGLDMIIDGCDDADGILGGAKYEGKARDCHFAEIFKRHHAMEDYVRTALVPFYDRVLS